MERYPLIILAGGLPWGKNNVGRALTKDAKEGPTERARSLKTPYYLFQFPIMCENRIFKYSSENIKNWRNTIWGRESTLVAIPAVNWVAAFWRNDLSAAPGGKSLVQSLHDGVDKCGNGNDADSNALRHCAFTSPLLYIHRALFCHFII